MKRQTNNIILALSILSFVGCQDRGIKTYRVAKEERPSAQLPVNSSPHASDPQGGLQPSDPHANLQSDPHSGIQAPAAMPHVHWALPAGWQEQKPDRMRAASFHVHGSDGRMAEVSVIPLPGAKDIENQSVNLWRQDLGLEPLSSAQFDEQKQKVDINGGSGSLYEMVAASPKAGEQFKTRVLGAIYPRDNVLWFIKMKGEDSLVAEQKPQFLNFLKSLKFDAPAQVASAEKPISTNSKEIPADSNLPKWQVPSNWKEQAPGPMLLATYSIAENGGQALVTISQLPGDAGGQVANIARWRGQLGLGPASEADSAQTVTSMEIEGKKAYIVDLKGTNVRTGKPARMVAAGVPRPDGTWFYKLTGDDPVVEKEKSAFIKFIQSAY